MNIYKLVNTQNDMNCQNCPFARSIGNNRFICTKEENQHTDRVVRGHWQALPECYETEALATSEPECHETETVATSEIQEDSRMPRTTANPSPAYKAVTSAKSKIAQTPSPAYSAVVENQNKVIAAIDSIKKLQPAPEETAIENRIRAIASQMPWIGSTSPEQRSEFLDGLRDGVRNLPAKNTRETSRYHLGYQAGRNNGSGFSSSFQVTSFLAS